MPLINKYIEHLLLAFHLYENLYSLFPQKILFQFLNIFCCIQAHYQIIFLITLLILTQITLYFSSNLLSFTKKEIYLISSKSLPYSPIFGSIMHKGLFFFRIIFVTYKIFKTFFSKRNFVRSYYFINVYIMYRNSTCVLVKFVFFNINIVKSYNFFTHFTYGNKYFLFYDTFSPLSS